MTTAHRRVPSVMEERLATPEGRAVYAKRKWIAEAPID
jgi:hypothetical protein